MAHYIAELIDRTEQASSVNERRRAQRSAAFVILRLWQHRATLPGRKIYPLRPYAAVLQMIERLQPRDNPFVLLQLRDERQVEQLASAVFDNLTRLVIALLLMNVPDEVGSDEVNPVAFEALDIEEQQIVTTIYQWSALFSPDLNRPRRKKKQQTTRETERVDLTQAATELIDQAMESLNELRNVLGNLNSSV